MNERPDMNPLESSDLSPEVSGAVEDRSQALERKPVKKKAIKPMIDSLESFLSALLKNRRLVVNDKILRTLKEGTGLDSEVRVRFLDDAAHIDVNLDLGRLLMLTAVQAYCYPRVAEILRDLARDLVMQHPALQRMSVDELFPAEGVEDAPRLPQISRRLGLLRDEAVLQRKKQAKQNTQKDAAEVPPEAKNRDAVKALESAIFATAFWRVSLRQAGIEEVLGCLHKELFPCKAEVRQVVIDLATFVSNSQDQKGISALMRWHAERVEQEASHSAFLAGQVAKKETELTNTIAERDAARSRIKELEELTASLQVKLDAEKEQRTTDCIHLRTEREQQRVHTLRTLESDVQLLSESLVALTREPPKVTVVHNYLTRVFESLGAEISYLKEL